MYLQHITFTSVSNLTHVTSKRGRFTQFGFTSTQAEFIEARAFGYLHPKPGYPLTLVMSGPNRWRDIYGWFDHSKKTITIPFYWSQLIIFSLLTIFSLLMLLIQLGAVWQIAFSWWLAPIMLAVSLVVACWYAAFQKFRRAYVARSLLLELARSIEASGRCA